MNLQTTNSGTIDINWEIIDTVLLDMDGTILDLNYDNHVWNNLVPKAFAKESNLDADTAKARMYDRMVEKRGTIDFYRFSHWSQFCNIDMVELHLNATDLVQLRPGAEKFIQWLRLRNTQIAIATNADRASFDIKQSQVDLEGLTDVVVSSHDYGYPKEDPSFWTRLQAAFPYDPARTLFIDDNETVLDAAAQTGIKHLLCVSTPDSEQPKRANLRYPSFDNFEEIFPRESNR